MFQGWGFLAPSPGGGCVLMQRLWGVWAGGDWVILQPGDPFYNQAHPFYNQPTRKSHIVLGSKPERPSQPAQPASPACSGNDHIHFN